MAARRKTTTTRRRRRYKAPPPDLSSVLASVLGGGGGAMVGGILANRGWDPAMVALGMAVGGGVGAYTLDGNMRLAAGGLAAAGAGQLALALLAEQAAPSKAAHAKATPKAKSKADARQAGYLPPGAIESAFERARHRLAMSDQEDPYFDAIDIDTQEAA